MTALGYPRTMSLARLLLLLLLCVPLALTGCPTADDDDTSTDDDDDADDDDESCDIDGDGYCWPEDCDETSADAYPGAPELCDGLDNDCDGEIEAFGDNDADGHDSCTDCDDEDPDVYPGAVEVCDGMDTDCDGIIILEEQDLDGDGFIFCIDDCGPENADIHPGAVELCDMIDNNCDGVLGAEELVDEDGDGWAPCQGDCDDEVPGTNPGMPELCNGVDDDCDGALGEPEATDDDGDGYAPCLGDCDDTDDEVHPGAFDVFGSAVDTDCDGVIGGTDTGFGPAVGLEADLLIWLEAECLYHGMAIHQADFESGTDGAVVGSDEGWMTMYADAPSGELDWLYSAGHDATVAFGGAQFSRTEVGASVLELVFDVPQTMVVFSLAGYDPGALTGYNSLLLWQGNLVASAPTFYGAPYYGDWVQLGATTLNNVGFNTFSIAAPDATRVLYLDDVWYCMPP